MIINNLPQSGGGYLLKHEAKQINYTTNFYVVVDLLGDHKVIDAVAKHGADGNVSTQNAVEGYTGSAWVPFVKGNVYRQLRAKHQGPERIGNFVSLAVIYEK